jgi:hypothetical protein
MIPVNADRLINPLGVGEIGIVGTSAALANAIYHATGQRLRDLPLRIGLITWCLKLGNLGDHRVHTRRRVQNAQDRRAQLG